MTELEVSEATASHPDGGPRAEAPEGAPDRRAPAGLAHPRDRG